MAQDVLQEIGRRAIEDRKFWDALRRQGAAAALEAGFQLTAHEQGALDSLLQENSVELSGLMEVLQKQAGPILDRVGWVGYWRGGRL